MTRLNRVALPVAALALLVGCGTPSAPVPIESARPSTELSPTPAGPTVSPSSAPSASPTPSAAPTRTGAATPSASASKPPTATPTRTPPPSSSSCANLVGSLSLSQQVGQLFMVGIDSGGLGRGDAAVLADGDVGSVIFLGNSTAGADRVARLVRSVRAVTSTPKGIKTMLTVDQEGGQVQRLKGAGFDRIPSARRQAELSNGQLRDDAQAWGEQLKNVGIDADLAPVADVVPKSFERINQPIGLLDRGYGPDVDVVADKVSAFVTGMDRAGIATSVKHFPGLGQVRGNTDFAARVVDRSTTRRDADLAGFAAGVKAGNDMVMVSTAFYALIDPDHRAAFSKKIIGGMVRGDLGFDGVVISDDLAARAVRDLRPGQRALQFLGAGGDLVIVGDPGLAEAMISAVTNEAKADPDFAAEVRTKATRVVQLKDRRGLADCG